MQEKHYGKTDSANKVKLFCFFRRGNNRNKLLRKMRNDPTEKCTKGVGHQIVDISCSEGEDLQKLNQQGSTKTEEKGRCKTPEGCPENGKKEAQRHKQQNIQKRGFVS